MSGESISIGGRPPEPAEPWQLPEPAGTDGSTEDPHGEDSRAPEPAAGVIDLPSLASDLLAQARLDARGKASMIVLRGPNQRAVLMALAKGAGLGEHASPPAASLQVVLGRVRLYAGPAEWVLSPGQLVAIPPERHAVDSLEDSVFLLTVTPPPR